MNMAHDIIITKLEKLYFLWSVILVKKMPLAKIAKLICHNNITGLKVHSVLPETFAGEIIN